ncbi:hypothetical protein EMCRGX_G034640 [Ephydatia muelleri]
MAPRGSKRKAAEKDTVDLDKKEDCEEVPAEKPTRNRAGANKGTEQVKAVESKVEESTVTKKAVGRGKNAIAKEPVADKAEKKGDNVVEEVKETEVQEPKEEKGKVVEEKSTVEVIEETVKETVTAKKAASRGKRQPQSKKIEEKEKENEEEPATSSEPVEEGKKKGKSKAGAKRKAEDSDEVEIDTDFQTRRGRSKVAKGGDVDAGDEAAGSKNVTDWSKISFSDTAKTKDGRVWNKKFSSWNVNGIRAWLKNSSLPYIQKESPDIFCLQETKCDTKDLPMDTLKVQGYHDYWSSGDTKGYSGTGIYTKEKPLNVTYGIGIAEHDAEGRVITLEFEKYYFVVAYIPNSGEKLKRLEYRQKWNVVFTAYLKKLDATKPVILCGDLNVAHSEIDLANPKGNTKTAGFTKEERQDFTALLKEGFVDSFRHLYPDRTKAYTYWSYRSNARAKNTGWRLDYFVQSERMMKDVCDCVIRSEVYGSDHCPLVLLMALN